MIAKYLDQWMKADKASYKHNFWAFFEEKRNEEYIEKHGIPRPPSILDESNQLGFAPFRERFNMP